MASPMMRRKRNEYIAFKGVSKVIHPTLENWSMIMDWRGKMCLRGAIYNRPGFIEGKEVTTSSIKWFNFLHKRAKTSNTLYALGSPDKAWLNFLKIGGFPSYNKIVEVYNVRG